MDRVHIRDSSTAPLMLLPWGVVLWKQRLILMLFCLFRPSARGSWVRCWGRLLPERDRQGHHSRDRLWAVVAASASTAAVARASESCRAWLLSHLPSPSVASAGRWSGSGIPARGAEEDEDSTCRALGRQERIRQVADSRGLALGSYTLARQLPE